MKKEKAITQRDIWNTVHWEALSENPYPGLTLKDIVTHNLTLDRLTTEALYRQGRMPRETRESIIAGIVAAEQVAARVRGYLPMVFEDVVVRAARDYQSEIARFTYPKRTRI